jgi:cytoskeletal protein CcmA (bactofilin family)
MAKKGEGMAKINDSAECLIGEGSVFEGRFLVKGSIRIEGKFQGDIRTEDQLIIAPGGKVKTDIIARRVVVGGTLIGNIKATEEVNLLETGKVYGNITTPKLSVEPGVLTEGKITINSGGEESVERAVNESFGEDPDTIFSSMSPPEKKKPEPPAEK